MRAPSLRTREGMTLIELLIAMVLIGLVVSAALSLMQEQQNAFALGTGRMDVLQRYRFAADELEENLRAVGTGVPDGQPFLVYAGTDVVSFNADFATNDSNNTNALYLNPTAPTAEVGSLPRGRRITLPGTSFAYPDSTYPDQGGYANSPAETITFFFSPDETTEREDDYALYRQVNDQAPAVVTRGLLHTEGKPFLSYDEVLESDSDATGTRWVSEADLPLAHSVPGHLSAKDAGAAARIDGVRAVRVAFTAWDGASGAEAQTRSVERVIRMPNAGRAALHTCGDPPSFSSSVSATQLANEPRVEIDWSRSLDDGGGESDVVRYAIFRQGPGQTEWGEPYFSVPAGLSSYSFVDERVEPGSTYTYAVAAQDCTPSTSALQSSPPVTVTVQP